MGKSGEHMFIGEYHHNLDQKGRLMLPVNLRNILLGSFVITRGIDECLYVYSVQSWEKLVAKIEELPLTKKGARSFSRMMLSGAREVTLDKQGRMNIPNVLLEYASLEKECVILGVGDKLEIWNKGKWQNLFEETKDDFVNQVEQMEYDL